jgi:CDP-paratose 2-epimerase
VSGYGGKQVRDNLHADDLADAFAAFHERPRPAAVYNIGGGRELSCSVLEAISTCEQLTGRKLSRSFDDEPRPGDHRWWISSSREFEADYPDWRPRRDLGSILREIHEHQLSRGGIPA